MHTETKNTEPKIQPYLFSPDHFDQYLFMLQSLIKHSYANNSLFYEHVRTQASIEEIVLFFRSSSGQSPFNIYIRQWMPLIPQSIRAPYEKHLEIEEVEDHAGMAKEMRENLYARVKNLPPLNTEMSDTLAYTFSAERVQDKSVGYFLGSFMTTEALSAKRSLQLFEGLRRNGIPENELRFLKIHLEADSHHSAEVAEEMILPALVENPSLALSVMDGVSDRLTRSTIHLNWYEKNFYKSLKG